MQYHALFLLLPEGRLDHAAVMCVTREFTYRGAWFLPCTLCKQPETFVPPYP